MEATSELIDHYVMGVFAENRNDLLAAEDHYMKVYEKMIATNTDIHASIDVFRLASFFYEIDHFSIANYFAKRSILSGSDRGLDTYVKTCMEVSSSSEEFIWLLPIVKSNPLFMNSCNYFRMLSQYTDVYQSVQEAFESVEECFIHNQCTSELYIEYLSLLIELEIQESNMPQARYYLRKWILLEPVYIRNIDSMLNFALYLDDLPYFWKRVDTLTILESIEEETKLFYEFASQLHRGLSVDESLSSSFSKCSFQDPLLVKKKTSYLGWQGVLEKKCGIATPSTGDWTDLKAYILFHGLNAFPYFKTVFTQFSDIEEAVSLYQVFTNMLNPPSEVEEDRLNGVSVTVLGGGDKIGGSCLVISINGSHLMIDAGAFVNSKDTHPLDLTPLDERNISLEDLDGLIITHAHMDHIGNVPTIHEKCESVPMYATPETIKLMWLMLKEQEKYDVSMQRKGLIDKCMLNITSMENSFTIEKKEAVWEIQCIASGHIRGAVSLLIKKDGKSIFVTGDYSVQDQRTVNGLRLSDNIQADIVITESTYGFFPTGASIKRKRQEKMFIQQLLEVIDRGGSVLIPAFALGRAQEILSIIRSYLPELPFPVYIDGMVSKVTEHYDRFLKAENSQATSLIGHGVAIAENQYKTIGFDNFTDQILSIGRCCIVASSGMLYEGTKSMAYAKKMLDDPKNAIVFTGYLDEESPGFMVSQSSPSILLDGEKKEINASVLTLRLSAHASREEIMQTVLSLNPKHVILVHGESNRTYKTSKMVNQPYPSITDLLSNTTINVTESKNGQTYHYGKEVVREC